MPLRARPRAFSAYISESAQCRSDSVSSSLPFFLTNECDLSLSLSFSDVSHLLVYILSNPTPPSFHTEKSFLVRLSNMPGTTINSIMSRGPDNRLPKVDPARPDPTVLYLPHLHPTVFNVNPVFPSERKPRVSNYAVNPVW